MENKKIMNPLFESLTTQARKFKTVPQISIYEADESTESMSSKEVEKYFLDILNLLQMNIVAFIQTIPQQDLKDLVMPSAMEDILKLGENASTDDLIKAFKGIWEKALGKITASEYKDKIGNIYAKANEGIEQIIKAYEALKQKAGDKIKDKALLTKVNSEMKGLIKGIQDSLQAAKTAIASAK